MKRIAWDLAALVSFTLVGLAWSARRWSAGQDAAA